MQIFGGNGFNTEYPVEKLMRDAKIYQVRIKKIEYLLPDPNSNLKKFDSTFELGSGKS